ncbi:cysteine and histidine-rich domain-containing protein 1 [Thalassophryne amazonica]|uniref:cysteine and histidine-rich domain-containing protein 1 n=1 Tax=Thalassophryne amazonica TaxID=390379 RepID=UPI00147155F9|nr:cysteine and histidine-rich domain-containing protein 1 [Thalassophryne amazonica]
MSLLCYNKGCGQKFHPEDNNNDSCVYHPGVPIFHDALKGWSCCKKRTMDFSEFLSIQGCTCGRHSNQKPNEPLKPDVTSHKGISQQDGPEIIYQGPKSAEKLLKDRPSADEAKAKLPHHISATLAQALATLKISTMAEQQKKESLNVMAGTRCKNSGCKTSYQGPETERDVCTHHPGAPVFHEGYKYWSCCCIKTTDFNAFLEQSGCTTGKHCWIPKQDKKSVACRYDWHQTVNNVVVTIYAKNANPAFCCIEANRTVLSCHLQFEDDKVFKKEFHLWGVVDFTNSFINMLPSKVEISLRKAEQVAWGKLEDPTFRPNPEPSDKAVVTGNTESYQPDWDIDDDDISDSDEEWAADTGQNCTPGEKGQQQSKTKEEEEETQKLRRKEVQEEMKRAMEETKRAMEERMRAEEEGDEDMPVLE